MDSHDVIFPSKNFKMIFHENCLKENSENIPAKIWLSAEIFFGDLKNWAKVSYLNLFVETLLYFLFKNMSSFLEIFNDKFFQEKDGQPGRVRQRTSAMSSGNLEELDIIWQPQIKDSLKSYRNLCHYCFNCITGCHNKMYSLVLWNNFL